MTRPMRSAVAVVIFVLATVSLFAVWLQRTLHHARTVRTVQWAAASSTVQPTATVMRPAVRRNAQRSEATGAVMERASGKPLVDPNSLAAALVRPLHPQE